jgi:hypothetical protein
MPCSPGRPSGGLLHYLLDDVRRGGRGALQRGRGQMRVALGHLGSGVAQDLLHLVQSTSTVYQKRRKIMATTMRRPVFQFCIGR